MHVIIISRAAKRRFIITVAVMILLVLSIIQRDSILQTLKMTDEKEEVTLTLEEILNNRSKVFLSGDYSALESCYDNTQKLGKWAWEHEIKRIKYLRNWAKERNIAFKNIESQVRVKKITKLENGRLKVSFDEVYRFDYVYKDDENPIVNSFGVRLMHVSEIGKDAWKFYKDWYLDCFNDAVSGYNAIIPQNAMSTEYEDSIITASMVETAYNREKAVEYADKHSGIPWADGGGAGYNKKYRNYNGSGGDCTNYISQCLGDKEAGGLRFDRTWYCHYEKYGNSMGSAAWLNAQKFKSYIIYSGKGRQIAKGTYKTLTAPNKETGIVPTSKLMLGDIISYEEKGTVVHNAIVTGFDSHGYPLVNTHTVDRYRVPWDLGWGDKDIQFFLIHIK